jgi:predicted DNA-binding transcriptional regulator AlpA
VSPGHPEQSTEVDTPRKASKIIGVIRSVSFSEGSRTLEEYLKDDQVAEEFQVSTATLANWRYLGRGPRFVKLHGAVRYRRSDLEAWVSEKSVEPQPAA